MSGSGDGNGSDWDQVRALMHAAAPVRFGHEVARQLRDDPGRLLEVVSRYKFAAKMIGRGRRVLDVGCGEGLGTWVLANECGSAVGLGFAPEAIASARATWEPEGSVEFRSATAFDVEGDERFDGVVCFDVLERVPLDGRDAFVNALARRLTPTGIAVIGTPNVTSAQHRPDRHGAAQPPLLWGARLEETLRRRFEFVFLLGANDEVVHTGFGPMCDQLIVVTCGARPDIAAAPVD